MRAIILAAGRGSRMQNATAERPKCLVELAGRPLFDWQQAALHGGGVSEIGVVTGYRAEFLVRPGIRAFYNPRWAETNMVSSLACASDWLGRDDCIISYSDIVYPAATIKALAKARSEVAITYDLDWLALWSKRFKDPLSDAESFRLGPDGFVAEIGQRTTDVAEIAGQYMGLLRFTPEGWAKAVAYRNRLEPDRRDRLDMTSLLRGLIGDGVKIGAVSVRGQWYEVDSEGDLAFCQAEVAALGASHWLNGPSRDAT